MFKFTIRDLLWLTVVVAVAAGWLSDATNKADMIARMKLVKDEEELSYRVMALEYVLQESGTKVEFLSENEISIVTTTPDGSTTRRNESFTLTREPKSW